MNTFYIVWGPASDLPPRRRFDTYQQAAEVAVKMTERYHQPFYVMQAKAVADGRTYTEHEEEQTDGT